MDENNEFPESLQSDPAPEEIRFQGSICLPALTAEGTMLQGLYRTIREQVLAELKDAKDSDKKNRKIPSLPTLAWLIREGKLYDRLPRDVIVEVADLLAVTHRGKRGAKENRKLHISRAMQFVENMIKTGDKNAALNKIADADPTGEYFGEFRTIERSVAKGLILQEDDLRAAGKPGKSLKQILEEGNLDYPGKNI